MNRSAPTIVLELRASRALRLGLLGVALLAAVAIALTRLPLAPQIALFVVVPAIAWFCDMRLRNAAGLRLTLAPDGSWRVHPAADPDQAYELAHSAEVGSLLSMTLVAPGIKQRLALMPDSANPGDLRRLRVWLRHSHADAQKAAPFQ